MPRKSLGNPPQPPASEDKIGYRRPPRAYQFKPGQSGNPSGRPKAKPSLADLLEEALGQRTTIRVRGRARKVTKLEAMTRKLADMAVQGDARVVKLLLDRIREAEERTAEEPAVQDGFEAADREVIAAMLQRLKRAP
ncbi:MAG TPA: DUF5681 domain-containing protein [Rhizomicrobium sp.]|nr:DUF5681 domain-containing protein [Rhizomicrobium sp.]